jgi:2-amino-4-hydroxy-6-hydroxymethyldihydropteridine diphosphokinase
MARVYIGLGSNVGDAAARVRAAIASLRLLGTVITVSSLYRTKPWGPVRDQPDFVNAVALLETGLSPHSLLDALKSLERELGRGFDEQRFGPREIDLDIELYDDLQISDERLTIPHPRLRRRAFVLVPLAEIDAFYRSWRDALPQSELAGVSKLPQR